jgi:hypothetical protein
VCDCGSVAERSTDRRKSACRSAPLPCRNTATVTADTRRELLGACQQLRQLRDIRSNPPRFIPREQFGRRSPPRLILEIDKGKLLAVVVADDKAGFQLIDRPRRREAAGFTGVARSIHKGASAGESDAPKGSAYHAWPSSKIR